LLFAGVLRLLGVLPGCGFRGVTVIRGVGWTRLLLDACGVCPYDRELEFAGGVYGLDGGGVYGLGGGGV
jgi:hypothetical protein